jgi:hypothetical protein
MLIVIPSAAAQSLRGEVEGPAFLSMAEKRPGFSTGPV